MHRLGILGIESTKAKLKYYNKTKTMTNQQDEQIMTVVQTTIEQVEE